MQQNGFIAVIEEEEDFAYNNVYNIYAFKEVNFDAASLPDFPKFNVQGNWSDPEKLKVSVLETCTEKLPEYMVPASLTVISEIPITINGKTDKNKLKALLEDNAAKRTIELPQTALQKELCAIWSEILEIDQVGITDNFFKIGGHSLKAVLVLL